MKIMLNGEVAEFAKDSTIIDILNEKEIDPETVVVEADGVICKREEFETTVLEDGSVLEVLRFVGGG